MLYYEFFVLKLIVCPAHIMMPALSVPTLFFFTVYVIPSGIMQRKQPRRSVMNGITV